MRFARFSWFRVAVIVGAVTGFAAVGLGETVVKWNPSAPLTSYWDEDSGGDEISPKLASDGNNTFVALWAGHAGVYAARSGDGGLTWSSEKLVAPVENARPVAVTFSGNGVWVAHWRKMTTASVFDFRKDYMVSRSTDGLAAVWSTPQIVSRDHLPANMDAASDGAGTLLSMDRWDRVLRSTDSGLTWSTVTLTGAPEAAYSGWQIASGGNGLWYAAISGEDGQAQREYVVFYTSVDNGLTWSVREIGSLVGGVFDMAAQGNKIALANWPDVYGSNDSGITWSGNPSHYVAEPPQAIAVDAAGKWMVAASMTMMTATDPAGPWTVPQGVTDMTNVINQTVSVAAGASGNFVMAGDLAQTATIRPGPDFDVAAFQTADGGGVWSAPHYLNDDADVDLPRILDRNAQLVSGDNGAVVAAWLANTYYLDGKSNHHVMFARSSDYGETWTNTAPVTPSYNPYLVGINEFNLQYAGQERWFLSWYPGNQPYWGSYAVSNDNGFTWSTPEIYFGELAAGSGDGTLVKVHNAGDQNVVRYGLARLPREMSYFEEPVFISERPRAICHSAGANWFLITEGGNVYTSADDGRTWGVATGSANVPPTWAKLATDGQGTIGALYYEEPQEDTRLLKMSVSQNNGVTWSEAVTVDSFDPGWSGGSATESLYAKSAWGDLASPGAGEWLAVWHRPLDPVAVTRYAISRNGGYGWGRVMTVRPGGAAEGDVARSEPTLTAANGRAVMGWHSGGNGRESDIFYNFGLTGVETAARDWQLFE